MALYTPEWIRLRGLWEEDGRRMIPDFELYDDDRMEAAFELARETLGLEGEDELLLGITVLRELREDDFGVPGAWWWIGVSVRLLEDMEMHPWYEIGWWAYNESRGQRRTNTLWGSASCGKTALFAVFVLVSMVVWYDDFHAYVTSPYKNAGSDKIWNEISKRVAQWSKHRPYWAEVMGLQFSAPKEEVYVTSSHTECMAKFVSLESTAAIQGKKRSRIAGQGRFIPRKGIILLIGDELIINHAACHKFLLAEGNISSNTNFMGWTGMNPLPTQVVHPNALELSAPVDIARETLNEHTDFTWRTQRGYLYRLCMDNSPNRFDDVEVFDYIIGRTQALEATKRGEDNYQAQVAAWGWGNGMGNGGVCSLEAVNRESNQGAPVWAGPRNRWIMFDLAFGGRDPAGYCCLEEGDALIGGQAVPVINSVEQQKMNVQRTWTPKALEVEEFHRLAKDRGGRAPDTLKAGVETDANHYMTWQVLRKSAELGIPRGRVSFDSSLRPDVTLMLRDALGVVPWFYSGTRTLKDEQNGWALWPPVAKPGDGGMTLWSDQHGQVISAVWRFAEHVVARGHLYGMAKLRKGLLELISRMWISGYGGKWDLQAKKDLATSPWAAETLSLAIMFGVRFCGALPQLGKEKAVVTGVGSVYATHPVFDLRPRKLNRRMWG